jgi:hypothetical protein
MSSYWTDGCDYAPAGHGHCEVCADYICPDRDCVEMDGCGQDGETADPSIWTSDGVRVHVKCRDLHFKRQAEFDAWASRLEAEGWAHNVVAGGAK